MRGPTRFASGVFVACHVVGSPWFVLRSVAPFGVQRGRRCAPGERPGAWRGCGHPARARRRIRARMRAPGVGAGVDAGADAAAGAWRGRRCGCGRGCGGGRLAWARMRAVVLGFRRRDSEKITIGINGTLLAVRTACSGGGRRIRRAAFPQVAGMQLLAFPRSRVCSRALHPILPLCVGSPRYIS